MTVPDIPTPEQVEAIRAIHVPVTSVAFHHTEQRCAACDMAWPCDSATLLADRDALTARAEAAERKVAAVRAVQFDTHVNPWSQDTDHGFAQGMAAAQERVRAALDDTAAQPPRFATQTPARRDETPSADGNATRVIPTAQEGA